MIKVLLVIYALLPAGPVATVAAEYHGADPSRCHSVGPVLVQKLKESGKVQLVTYRCLVVTEV